MSWELIHEEKHPCPCGKSTYTDALYSDDWNQTELRWEMNCPECKANYKLERKQVFRSGEWNDVLKWVAVNEN